MILKKYIIIEKCSMVWNSQIIKINEIKSTVKLRKKCKMSRKDKILIKRLRISHTRITLN